MYSAISNYISYLVFYLTCLKNNQIYYSAMLPKTKKPKKYTNSSKKKWLEIKTKI